MFHFTSINFTCDTAFVAFRVAILSRMTNSLQTTQREGKGDTSVDQELLKPFYNREQLYNCFLMFLSNEKIVRAYRCRYLFGLVAIIFSICEVFVPNITNTVNFYDIENVQVYSYNHMISGYVCRHIIFFLSLFPTLLFFNNDTKEKQFCFPGNHYCKNTRKFSARVRQCFGTDTDQKH